MLRGFRSQHAQRVSSFFSCTQWRYSSYTSGCITTERRSPLSERIRTPDDLNLRLSTCLYYQQPAAAINLFEQARRERLPFNDTSIEYVVYNLTEKGLYRKAEQILDDYNTQERVPPPEKAYRYILSSYAKKGDFKNLQLLFHKMNKAEVPISEKTYQHVLQHAENYLLQKDTTSSSNCKKKWQKQERNLPLSSATPHQTFTASFETFVESVHKEDNSKKEKPASNEKGDRSSLLKEQTFKSLINDEDLAATKATKSILDDSEENENYLPSKGLYALLDGDHKSANSFLLRAIMDIFQTTESSKVAENNQLNNMIQMEGTQDLGGFSDMSEDNYNLLSLYQPGEEADGAAGQQGNGGHQQPKIQYCSLTGARLTEQNVANSEDLKIPFHDTPDDPFSVRYKYLVSDKEPISEMFSVEDKIDRGEGIMLEINDDISFSLTYDRSTVADRSVLSQLVRDGLEATPELYAAVVDGYGRGGNTNARDVAIHEMQLIGGTPNNSVINRTITTYARNLSMSELESTLDWATNHKVSLTSTTLNAILHAYTRNNEFTKAEAIVKQLEQLSSYKTNPNHEASVLYMKAIQGDSQAIEQALKERSQSDNPPTTQTYGGIISGYAKVNDHDKVCSYYKQMRQQNIPPSEEIFHDVFTSFYQKRDLHGLTECLWTARQYGFRNYLNAKRTECIIELLCEEKHFTQVIKLFGHYQQMPHLLRPRNFTFLLRGLLQNEGLSVINTLEPNMRWPCFVALAMIYGPKAREAKKSIFQLLEDDGHEITDKVVEAATYYYLQKGEFSQVMQCFAYVKVADPPIDPTAKLYAFVFLANFRDRKIKKVSKLIMNMIVNDKIGLSDLATAAKNNLSFANFNELCEEFSLYTEINLRDHVEEKSEQPNILDYLG